MSDHFLKLFEPCYVELDTIQLGDKKGWTVTIKTKSKHEIIAVKVCDDYRVAEQCLAAGNHTF